MLCFKQDTSMKINKGQYLLNYAEESYGSCTLFDIEIYLQIKFQVDISDSFCVMLRPKFYDN